MKYILTLYTLCFIHSIGVAQSKDKQLIFDKLSNTQYHQSLAYIIESAYHSLDIEVKYISHPLSRSYTEANLGYLSGLMGRVEDRENLRPNLIRIAEPVGSFNIVLVVNTEMCELCELDSLDKVASVTGFEGLRFYLSELSFSKKMIDVPNRKILFEMMERNRFQAFIASDVLLPEDLLKAYPHWKVKVLTTDYLFHYLHKSHINLVNKIENALLKSKIRNTQHTQVLNL